MASSSSSVSSRTWRYSVFTSFHGPDVRKTFLAHLHKQFNYNGISMFDDQGIERGQTIAPALTRAIGESRISIVVLTKNYASSSWCLDELLEILRCKEAMGQIVMTIFYGVDPSDVRNQTGEFGSVFNDTCERKTKEKKRGWSQALNDVGNIAGEHFLNWDNEAEMIEKIARDVSNKLNATPSMDFDGMVGLEAHLSEMQSLLDLDDDGVKMVAIFGPAGIGKSTIARALHSLLCNKFQRTCFVDNLGESYPIGLDEHGYKLRLQKQLLSNMLNQDDIRIHHLGVMQERLRDQRVPIILDDVTNLKQLEALANKTTWFGPRSRIIVTTENKELLQLHGIKDTYHVGFPSDEEALKILCRYAFKQSYPHNGFKELALRVTELCGNLPLGLRVVGSSLHGKKEDEWEDKIRRLETILDHQDIEGVLRIGYESLHENEQSLFLHIAVFFNYNDGDRVKAMFADNKLDIKQGLRILANKSLISMSTHGNIVMHKLLQQVGTKVVHSEERWKHRILINAQEICDVLERGKGTSAVSGISFDIYGISEVFIIERAFKRMRNLRFLKVYKSKDNGNDILRIPEEMELPQCLRLLNWKAYPNKCLPPKFSPEYLVELDLQHNQLEKLWEGTQPLTNLKKMQLSFSRHLKKLPDLSNATNLEELHLVCCLSLEEIPPSIGNLHKLEVLQIAFCENLQVFPAHFNLASLEKVDMLGCIKLVKFPDISTNITSLIITDTMFLEPESMMHWSRLQTLDIMGSRQIDLDVEREDIVTFPDCIKDLCGLENLCISGCPKLVSLPVLPSSLRSLIVDTCESLETVTFPLYSQLLVYLHFPNCFKLGQEERRRAITHSLEACLPGRNIPAEFDHITVGNSLTIRSDLDMFRICVVISPKQDNPYNRDQVYLLGRIRLNGCPTDKNIVEVLLPYIRKEHLFIFSFYKNIDAGWLQQDNEIFLEFSTSSHDIDVFECGVESTSLRTKPRKQPRKL